MTAITIWSKKKAADTQLPFFIDKILFLRTTAAVGAVSMGAITIFPVVVFVMMAGDIRLELQGSL